MPRLSIVIPTRGRTTRLWFTLVGVANQSLSAGDFETILVDDNESPGHVREVLARLGDALRVTVVGGPRRGISAVRNAGAAAASGDLLLFLDDDTIPTPGLAARHLAAHGGPGPAVVHGHVLNLPAFRFVPDELPPAERLDGAGGRSLAVRDVAGIEDKAAALGARPAFVERVARAVTNGDEHRSLAWLSCIGTNTSVPAAAFASVGGFDERYAAGWGGEDVELGLRLSRRGAAFATIDAAAFHVATVRWTADSEVDRFWELAAELHDDPRLSFVATFLKGGASLDELRRHLVTGGPGRPPAGPAESAP